MKKHDGLSTSICILCYGKLDNFHNFALGIRKVQDELASTTKNKEVLLNSILIISILLPSITSSPWFQTQPNNDLENGDEFERGSITYQDFESESKYNPKYDMLMNEEVQFHLIFHFLSCLSKILDLRIRKIQVPI